MSKQIGWLIAFILGVGLTAVFYPRSEYDKLNKQLNDLYEQRVEMNAEITTIESRIKEIQNKPVVTGHIVPVVEAAYERSDYDLKLMNMICEKGQLKGKKSPLCDNWSLYDSLAKISKNKGVPFHLMIGIVYQESHIGVNFAPSQECGKSNNRAGLKGAKLDNGKLDWGKMPTSTWGADCWLYNFQSVEQFWGALANTLMAYEKNCGRDAYCISVGYVGGKGVKNNWGHSVGQFDVSKE